MAVPFLLFGLTSGLAVVPPTPEAPPLGGGWFGRIPFEQPERPPDVRMRAVLEIRSFEFHAQLHIVPADTQIRTRLLLDAAPEFSAEVGMTPANMRVYTLIDLNDIALAAQLKAVRRKKDS